MLKVKKKSVKLERAKTLNALQEEYVESVVKPAERLANLITGLQKRKSVTSRLRSA